MVKILKILSKIKDVMLEVDREQKEIKMSNFYLFNSMIKEDTDIRNCGTPACVIGYCVLDDDFREIIGINSEIHQGLDNLCEIAWGLIEECSIEEVGVFDSQNLADSIFGAEHPGRKSSARMFLGQLNKSLNCNFLNRDDVTAVDVVEYLDFLIEHVKNLEK